MKRTIPSCLLFLILTFPLIAAAAPISSHYLFVWAMEAKHPAASTITLMSPDLAVRRRTLGLGKDFLAVFDIRPGRLFGKLVAMLPVGNAAMAHHTNYAEPPNDVLYANDWIGNRTYVFDLRNPPAAAEKVWQHRRLPLSTLLCVSCKRQYAGDLSVFRRVQPCRGWTGGVRSAGSGCEDRLGGCAWPSRYSSIQPLCR
jgi:hypothetical protein